MCWLLDCNCTKCHGLNLGDPGDLICEVCQKMLDQIDEEENPKSKGTPCKKKEFLALWYSVSPPRVDPYIIEDGKDFVKRMNKFFNSMAVEKAIWTYEWKYKGDPLGFHGIHCHSLIYGTARKINWHISRQKEKWFNLNKKQKFVIYKNDEELVQDKVSYFVGDTWDL